MSRFSKYFLGIFVVLTLSQCFPEEEPIVIPDFGPDSKIETIEMGPDYEGQHFFDLGRNLVVSSNDKTDWDLAFECKDDRYYIWLNGAKTMKVATAPTKELDRAVDLNTLDWRIDGSGGDIDSNAIGNWADFSQSEIISHEDVYVLDRGEDAFGEHLGYKKFKLVRCAANTYEVIFVNLDGSGYGTIGVTKEELYNFKYLSFNDNQIIPVEPAKVDWDLVFTRYTVLFYVPDLLPYQVTGVLLNPYQVEAAQIDSVPFEELTIDNIGGVSFSNNWDAIGFNWKDIDINSGLFSLRANRSYIVKDVSGDYFKLRFIDFYNEQGEKGFPKFEYQKL